MKLAIDAMGGDTAPEANLLGLKDALELYPDVESFILVGDEAVLRRELPRYDLNPNHPRVELVHASQVIEMGDPAATALRAKKDSSITVAADLLKQRRVDAVISAGHTGATVATMLVKNRSLPGIERPGIATVLPTGKGAFVMIDVGANVDCKPVHLAHYAILGNAYSRIVLGVDKPRVGLLSVGTEDGKGNELTKESAKYLKQMPIHFIGNIEGHDLFSNHVDVVVCDGFVGNAVLKSAESLAKAMSGMLRANLRKNLMRITGAWLSKNAFRELRELTDHEEYGGAPLLGINGVCIIAHGASTGKSICNAIRVSREMVKKQINAYIGKTMDRIDWARLSRHESS